MATFFSFSGQSADRPTGGALHAVDAAFLLFAGISVVLVTAMVFPSLEQGSPCLWDMFNDQFNYLTAAHNLAQEGRLQSNVVYPSLLRQEHPFAFLYMPGTPAVFAAALQTLGNGMAAVLVPGVLAYLIGTLAVWYAASRISGRFAGLVAGLLYLSFPMHVGFLHTAMTEQLLGAACAVVLALGTADGKKSWYLPATAAALAAVLLRETALAYFVVLAGLLLSLPNTKTDLRRLAAPISGLIAGLVLIWYWTAARPSLFAANLLLDHRSAVYLDAYALDGINVNVSTLMNAMGERLQRNAAMVFSSSTLNPEEYLVLGGIVLALGFCLVRGAWRRDLFCLALGLAGLVAVVLLASTYKIEFFKGSRFLAFLWPACSIALARVAPAFRSSGTAFLAVVLLIGLSTSYSLAAKRAAVCERWFDQAVDQELFLRRHAVAGDRVIAAQDSYGMSWALSRPGTRWAFMPSNLETFRILKQKVGIDLIVLAPGPHQPPMVESLRQEGYRPVDSHETGAGRYLLLAAEDRRNKSKNDAAGY